jgi:hypothetical protein
VDANSEYGRIYNEVCKGFSIKQTSTHNKIYFKHPTISEHFSIYGTNQVFLDEGKKKGLQSEKEKIEEAINGGWWSEEKEFNINFLKKTIRNLIKTKEKLLYPSQKNQIDKQIKQNEAIFITYSKERKEIVGYTLEDYANSKLTEELLISFTYKNDNFLERLFLSREDYYNLTEEEVGGIKTAFDQYTQIFNYNNLRKTAICGFFQNLVYLNDDAFSFWGAPVVKCSKYQIDVLLYGKMYKNMIKNHAENGKPIPDDILSDPNKFIDWIDNQSSNTNFQSKNNKKSNSSNFISNPVGATKEDLDKLGVKVEKLKGKSLLQLAEEKGGVLEKNDYLSARENN